MASINKTKKPKAWEKKSKPKFKSQYTSDELAKEYNTPRWRKLSRMHKAHYPLCVECLKINQYSPVAVSDHINPVSEGGDMWDWDNLQSLCTSCHQRKTANEQWARKRN